MRSFCKMVGLLLLSSILSAQIAVAVLAGHPGTVTYHPIRGVGPAINKLGRRLAQAQRDEVWTGGNEQSGCYMDTDADRFHHAGKLQKILRRVRSDPAFRPGIAALRRLPVSKLTGILNAWNRPIDPTWAENGYIGSDGTTEAGNQIETEIAAALTQMIQSAVRGK